MLLSLETSTPIGSVALFENKKLLAFSELHLSQSHSSQLIVIVKQLLEICQRKTTDITQIALAEGPGSYTGLRIGASTAKGLAYSLGQKEIFAVNTLQAMAQQAIYAVPHDVLLCPMLDARRMEVFCALFTQKNENNTKIAEFYAQTTAKIIDEGSFLDILDTQKVCFFGDGMPKCRKILEKNKNAFFLDSLYQNIYPTAKEVGFLASHFPEKYAKNVDYFEPFYLKEVLIQSPN